MKNPMNDIIATWESMGGKIKCFADTCIAENPENAHGDKRKQSTKLLPWFFVRKISMKNSGPFAP